MWLVWQRGAGRYWAYLDRVAAAGRKRPIAAARTQGVRGRRMHRCACIAVHKRYVRGYLPAWVVFLTVDAHLNAERVERTAALIVAEFGNLGGERLMPMLTQHLKLTCRRGPIPPTCEDGLAVGVERLSLL